MGDTVCPNTTLASAGANWCALWLDSKQQNETKSHLNNSDVLPYHQPHLWKQLCINGWQFLHITSSSSKLKTSQQTQIMTVNSKWKHIPKWIIPGKGNVRSKMTWWQCNASFEQYSQNIHRNHEHCLSAHPTLKPLFTINLVFQRLSCSAHYHCSLVQS